MVKYCAKMEMTTKLNFTIFNFIYNVILNVTRKWKEKYLLRLLLLIFFQFIWVG